MSNKDSSPTKKATPKATKEPRNRKTGKGVGVGNGRLTNAERAARDLLIVQLFNRGENLTVIAEMVGMSGAKAVSDALRRIMEERITPETDVLRAVEAERVRSHRSVLEPYLHPEYLSDGGTDDYKVVQARVEKQLSAVALDLKVGERYSKLTGLDMPTKQEITGDGAVPFVVQMNWPSPQTETTEVVNQEDLKS